MANKQIYQLTETLSVSPDDWLAIDLDSSNLTRKARVGNVFSVSEGSSYTGGTANGIMFNDGNTFSTASNLIRINDGVDGGLGVYSGSDNTGNDSYVLLSNLSPYSGAIGSKLNSQRLSGGQTEFSVYVANTKRYSITSNGGFTIGRNVSDLGASLGVVNTTDIVAHRIDLSNGQTADAFQINSYGNTGGDVLSFSANRHLTINLESGANNSNIGFEITKGSGYISLINGTSNGTNFLPRFIGRPNFDAGYFSLVGEQNGTNSTAFVIRGQSSSGNVMTGGNIFEVRNFNTTYLKLSQVGIGITPQAKLHVKGSGTTSATTALLVEDSLGTDLLKVTDEGSFYINGSRTFTNFNNNSQLTFNNAFTDDNAANNTYFALVDIDYTWDEKYSMSGAYVNDIRITPNFDGQVSGNQDLSKYVSIYIKPTFGSNLRNVTYKGIYLDTPTFNQVNSETYHPLYITSGNSYFGGNVGIGTTSPSAKLHTSLSTDVVGNRLDLSNGQTEDAFQINSYGNTGGDLFRVNSSGNILAISGSAASPSYSFVGDTDTGIQNPYANAIMIVGGGNTYAEFSTGAIQIYKPIRQNTGYGAANIGFQWTGDTDSGVIHGSNADEIGIATGGVQRFLVSNSGINMSNLPTSSAGLSSGDLWNDSGTIKIV